MRYPHGPIVENHGWWWPWLGGLVPLIVLGLLIAFGIWAVLRVTSRGSGAAAQAPTPQAPQASRVDPALAELRLRYARGELSREEFLQRTTDLGGRPEADANA